MTLEPTQGRAGSNVRRLPSPVAPKGNDGQGGGGLAGDKGSSATSSHTKRQRSTNSPGRGGSEVVGQHERGTPRNPKSGNPSPRSTSAGRIKKIAGPPAASGGSPASSYGGGRTDRKD